MRTLVASRKHDRSFARAETEIAGAIAGAGSDPQEIAGATAARKSRAAAPSVGVREAAVSASAGVHLGRGRWT